MDSPTASEQGRRFGTLTVQHMPVREPVHPLATPIFASSTFILDSAAHGARLSSAGHFVQNEQHSSSELLEPSEQVQLSESPWLYSRWANPTSDVCARILAQLEGGANALMCASGMAAITTALFANLKSGDHVVTSEVLYGGTHEVMKSVLPSYGIEVSFVDSRDISNYAAAIKPNTKILYGETITNPTMAVLDLEGFGALGKSHPGLVTLVDNTFASPRNQNPIKYGVDIVIHSATKYIGGHSDVIAGAIVSATKEIHECVFRTLKLFGGTLSPFDCFLLVRGLKTLDVRMERHNHNALCLARFLEGHPKVKRVWYPGLESHPQHQLAKSQLKGFGGMVAFEVDGGAEGGRKVIESVRIITLAVSLGGVESLIEQPSTMTHCMVSREERAQSGITDGLLRFSVGIESTEDLIADLTQALNRL